MAPSLFSSSPSSNSWRRIRSLRAAPDSAPRQGLKQDRQRVFQAALEQAQQQFTAAAGIGYESRPLNLFYGLSQAGRAVAAASPKLGAQNAEASARQWKARGHGLKMSGDPNAEDFFGSVVEVLPGNNDLFSRLSVALGSPVNTTRVRLSALVSQIPEYERQFGVEADCLPVLNIPGITRGVPYSDSTSMGITFPHFGATTAYESEEVLAVVRHYPALESFVLHTGNLGAVGGMDDKIYGRQVYLEVNPAELEISRDGQNFLPRGWRFYRGEQLYFPRIADSSTDLHPLASWWILLFALSIAARYSPEAWTALMSVSASPLASKVEHLLDVALDAVPELIAETLERSPD